MFSKRFRLSCIAFVLFGVVAIEAMPAASRITLPSGKKIFLSGMNLAWKNYAGDVGDTPLDSAYFSKAMKAIADSGANCMRIWLSTDGTNDPKYGSDGLVSGPGSQTITNIQKMLKLAKTNNLLVMPVLLTHNWVNKSINATILANNKKMLTTEAGLQAYIDKYLVPVVTAIGNDPNLVCWEIFNEPEGMVDGWSSPKNTITQAQVQKSVNWIAAAIHKAVPNVLVSNGAASTGTLGWYTDAALNTAGSKAAGTLDFYMAHYYGWNGTSNSPFTKPYSGWSLDKPLVIGEYASSDWSTSTKSTSTMQDAAKVDTLLTYLDKAGYAGGLGWQYQQDGGDSWMKGFSTFGHSMMQAYRADSSAIKLTAVADNTFLVMGSASNGGTAKSSASGRVASGTSVTLTATADAGYTFSGWTGDTTTATAILIIKSVTKDWSLKANFVPAAGTNLIKGGDFTDNTNWTFYADADNGNTATAAYDKGQADITITKADTLNYHIQLSQGSIALDSGVTYLVTFDAWSSAERKLIIGLSTASTWHWEGGGQVTLTTTKANYSVEITPDSSTVAGILQFNLGASTLPAHIDNVTFTKKTASSVFFGKSAKSCSAISIHRVGDAVYWSAPTVQATASLMDLNGRTINVVTKSNILHLNGVPTGVYLVVVKYGLTSQVFRFTK